MEYDENKKGDLLMRKLLFFAIILFAVCSVTTVCYAGSVPEDLLSDDDAQVYFGEIKSFDGDNITVIQRQNVKGRFEKDSEITYTESAFTDSPTIGEQYLFGYLDDNNPLYIWEVTSLDTRTLEIKKVGDGSMSQRMQDYLNDGKFEEKERQQMTVMESDASGLASEDAEASDTEGSFPSLIWIFCGVLFLGLIALVWKRRKH